MLRPAATRRIGIFLAAAMGIVQAQAADSPMAQQWTPAELETGYVVFQHSTLDNLPSTHVPARKAIADKVSCALAQGQYGAVQIGVHALADGLTNIRAEVTSDLGVTVYHRIEPGTLKQLIDDGEMRPWYEADWYLQKGDVVADLAKGQSVNFRLTFRADAGTATGLHESRIRIEVDDRPATELDLAVRVRPFELASPRIAFGMWYEPSRLPGRLGSWSITDDVALKVFRDLAAHGQNSVSLPQAGDFSQLPPRSRLVKDVKLALQAGLLRPDIPCHMESSNIQANSPYANALSLTQINAAADWLDTQHREHGWPEIMVYGRDEPPYPAPRVNAPGIRESWAPLRDVPIRVATAMDSSASYGHGELHDVWMVIGGDITPAMCAEAARMGAQVWTYSYRIWREDFRPVRQRYYAGLYTWAHRLGGNLVWAYAHGHHSHVWFEPGSEEPMPVTAWEARREGVDDYRYLQMVEDLTVAKADDPMAVEAASWLETLRARVLPIDPHLVEAGRPLAVEEYTSIREAASQFIGKLGPMPADRPAPRAVTRLKDEAAGFRGKSVQQCIAGLSDQDAAQRRAAAWALCEMGAEAAPAVTALTAALDDQEVRFPALHALEAIGAEACAAAPSVASLLSDDDHFVRLAATYALAGVARSPSWDDVVLGYDPNDVSPHVQALVPLLRQALSDYPQSPNSRIVMAASLGLFCCGEAGRAALADANALLERVKTFKTVARREADMSREGALRILAGLGTAAATAVPRLIEMHDAAQGRDILVARALAAIGPAASDAVAVLEKHQAPDSSSLADTCYALFCIRGDEADLKAIADILFDESRPYADRRAAARYLIALGGKAAPVAGFVRENLPKLQSVLRLDRRIRESFFTRAGQGAPPLRLLPR